MDEVVLLPITSDRPEAFALCERWMSRQDYEGSYHWIVVDDGVNPVRPSMDQQYIRREPTRDGLQSFRKNLIQGLSKVYWVSRILFIEDDAYYRPDYISFMMDRLDKSQLVGEGKCRDYDVRNGRNRICKNRAHASLCQTGMTSPVIEEFLSVVIQNNQPNLDELFWKDARNKFDKHLTPESEHSVNIKGMPGKTGLIGHDMGARWPVDKDGSVLRRWVGEEAAEIYMKYRERS